MVARKKDVGIKNIELARRDELKKARRLLDPYHRPKLLQLDLAFEIPGRKLVIGIMATV